MCFSFVMGNNREGTSQKKKEKTCKKIFQPIPHIFKQGASQEYFVCLFLSLNWSSNAFYIISSFGKNTFSYIYFRLFTLFLYPILHSLTFADKGNRWREICLTFLQPTFFIVFIRFGFRAFSGVSKNVPQLLFEVSLIFSVKFLLFIFYTQKVPVKCRNPFKIFYSLYYYGYTF